MFKIGEMSCYLSPSLLTVEGALITNLAHVPIG